MRRRTLLGILLGANAAMMWLQVGAMYAPLATDSMLAMPPGHSIPAGAGPESAPLADRFQGRPAAEFAQTTSRPLFWPSRRPIAAVAPPPAVETSTPSLNVKPVDIRLAGIMQVGRTSRRALLVWPQQPTGQWIDEGAVLDGWRVLAIDTLSVRIGIGTRVELLQLY